MYKIALSIIAVLSLAACATTSEPSSTELAYCQKMEREMGTRHTHDHAEAKGMGLNPMNVTHVRCRQMVGLT
jgi:hypothetical protein